MRRVRRLRLWVVRRHDLLRMLDDAHMALRRAHGDNVQLADAAARLGAEVHRLSVSGDCPGRVEHVRLAARAEHYERLWQQKVDPEEQLTTLQFEDWRPR